MKPAQRRIAVSVGVLALLGGIAYFGNNRPAAEVLMPGPPTERAGVAQPPPPATLPSATTEPALPPTLRIPERVQPAPATLPSATENWEDAVRKMTVEQERACRERQHWRVTYAKIQRVVDELGLTGAARKRLEQLLFDKEFASLDIKATVRELGLSPKDPQVGAWQQSERAAIDNEIRSLVGNDNFDLIEVNFSGMRDRFYAIEFIGELYQRGMSLSAKQRATVDQLIIDLDAGNAQRWVTSSLDPATGLTVYDLSFLRELAGALTPEQLEVVRQTRIEANLYRAYQDYRRAHPQTKAPGP